MKGGVTKHDDRQPGRVAALGEGVEIVDDLGLGARAAEFADFELLSRSEERQAADEVAAQPGRCCFWAKTETTLGAPAGRYFELLT